MKKVKTLKEFQHSGMVLFEEGEEIRVKEYGERYFFTYKKKSILLPEGIVEEIEKIKEEKNVL